MELTKRQFLCSGLAAVSCGPAIAIEPENSVGGCLISTPRFQAVRNASTAFGNSKVSLFDRGKHIRTTGNPALDRALDASIKRLSDLFNQIPAFGFYREEDHPDIGEVG